jgi:hypothetical protein
MRFQFSAVKTALLFAIAVDSTCAFAQFNYSSQTRSISADALAGPDIDSTNPVDDVESANATDFNSFVDSRSASATFSANPGQTAMANTSQNSQLVATTIMASGSVSDLGFRGGAVYYGRATANSLFSATFAVGSPTDIQVVVNLFAHHGTISPSSSISASSTFSLVGGAVNLEQATTIPIGLEDNAVQFLQSLSLPSGTYTVTASVQSDSGLPDFETTIGNDLASSASYSVSVSVVPEPPSLALLATAAFVLMVRNVSHPPQPRSAARSGRTGLGSTPLCSPSH